MNRSAAVKLALIAFCICFSGCDSFWKKERYELIAVDEPEQMSLSFNLQNGTYLGLVEPTVFAIGANDEYIVVKQHPRQIIKGFPDGPPDRSITNYFIVRRISSPEFAERKKGVRGPLKKEEFDKLVLTLSLPPFSKTFDNLK